MIKRIILSTLLAVSSYSAFGASYELSNDDLRCLSTNIYFESRNQSIAGRIAVGLVTLNRVRDKRWPDTVCGVVHQAKMNGSHIIRNKCQFSWYCDGLSDTIRVISDWEDSVLMARNAVRLFAADADFTEGSTHYHSTSVYPWWADSYQFVVRIDDHKFYK